MIFEPPYFLRESNRFLIEMLYDTLLLIDCIAIQHEATINLIRVSTI